MPPHAVIPIADLASISVDATSYAHRVEELCDDLEPLRRRCLSGVEMSPADGARTIAAMQEMGRRGSNHALLVATMLTRAASAEPKGWRARVAARLLR